MPRLPDTLDLDRIREIKNDPTLTDAQKHKLAYKEVWGVSFGVDLGIRLALVAITAAIAIGIVLLLSATGV